MTDDGQAGGDTAGTRKNGADRAKDSVKKVGDGVARTAAEGAATEDAADSAGDATENTAEQVAEQVADGAASKQVLEEVGDGAEEVAEQGQGSGLLDGTGGGTTTEDASQGTKATNWQSEAADTHGHGLVEAGHGINKSLHEAVGVVGVLLDHMAWKGSDKLFFPL